MDKIKLIAFDLDGTLTQHKQPLSEENRRTLDALAQRYRLVMVGAGQVGRIFRQMGGYPIDVHSPDGEGTLHKFLKPGSWYSIPYRCLITNEIENLIVAGRCISATQEACSSTRLTPIVMALGQAAGTAAAQSIREKTPANALDTDLLRDTLKKDGVFLEEYKGE